MSRIHDALRRGPKRPAVAPAGQSQRAVQTDAVLAALGYRSERAPRRAPVVIVLVIAVVALGWMLGAYWPSSTVSSQATSTHRDAAAAVPRPAPVAVPGPSSVGASRPAPENGDNRRFDAGSWDGKTAVVPVSPARAKNQGVGRPQDQRPAPGTPQRDDPPAAAPAAPATATTDLQLALYYHRAGDFEQALVQYKKVLQRDELSVEAHNNLGMLYQGKGLYEDAAREFQRVLAIEPSYVTARLNLSAAYLKLGRPDAAAAEARAVLAREPRHSDALINLALAQDAAGQPGDARLSLRRALEIAPHHPVAHYNLAQQYEKAGEPALALDHYRQFLEDAGPDQAPYVADVRARVQTLARGNR